MDEGTSYGPALAGTPFASHVDGVFVVDRDGTLLGCNDQLLSMTGYDRRDLVGAHYRALIDEAQRGGILEFFDAARRTSHPRRVSVRGRSKESAALFLEMTMLPQPWRDETVVVVRDAARSFEHLSSPDPVSVNLNASRLARFSGWSIDVATGETTWGAEMFAILGFDEENAPPYPFTLELFYDEPHRSRVEAAVAACVAHATPFDLECKIRHRKGHELDARIIGQGVRDVWGRVVRVEGAFHDVTELVRQRDVDIAAQNQLLETFAGVSMPLFLIGRDWTFHYVNQAGLALARLNAEVIGETKIWEFEPEIEFNSFARVLRAAMDDGMFGTAVERISAINTDVEIVAYPTPQGVLVTARNVTEEQEAKRQVEVYFEAANSFAKMLDLTKDAVIVRSLTEGVTYWNQGAVDLYGWTFDEVRGTRPEEYLYPGGRSEQVASILQGVERDGYWSGELIQQSRDGRVITVESRLTLWRDAEGQPVSIFGVHTDVTEVRRQQEARHRDQRMESLGTLAGGIAHDLNNVFTPMVLTLEMMSLRPRDERDRELLSALSTSVARASDMVRQVLTFARGVEGVRSHVSLARILEELHQICLNTLPKNIKVDFPREPLVGAVWGDETQLMQVFVNLVTNSRDAMPDGGRLRVRVRPIVAPPGGQDANSPRLWVNIEVADTGVGMDETTRARIFEPFFTTKEFGRGTGLGLSTSMAIVKSHGGRLILDSVLGEGTTVTLQLPFDDDAVSPVTSLVVPEARVDERTGRILVVDDEEAIVNMLAEVLRDSGYDVATALSAPLALDLLQHDAADFDLILTDVNMPELSGAQFAQRVLERRADANIIFMSGVSDDELRTVLGDKSALRFLPKPFSMGQLLDFVEGALR